MEVYKTESARFDGQGIGGQVNLVTRSAFDSDGMSFTATGIGGIYSDQNAPEVSKIGHAKKNEQDELSYRAEATFTNTFGEDDRFGLVLSGFSNRKKRDQERLIPGIVPRFYNPGTGALEDINTQDAIHLGGVCPRAGYSNEVHRWGGLGKLEFRNFDGLDISLRALYTQQDESERTDQGTILTFFPPPTGATNNNTLNFPDTSMNLRSQLWDVKKFLFHMAFDADREWDEDHTSSFQAVYSKAGYAEIKPRVEIRGFTTGPVDISRDGTTNFTNPNSFFLDPANYTGGNINASNRDFTDDDARLYEFTLDHAFNTAADDSGLGFNVGGRYRSTNRKFNRIFEDYIGGTSASAAGNVGDFLISGLSYTPRRSNAAYPIIDITSFDFDAARNGNNPDLTLGKCVHCSNARQW